eukprot:4066449-Pleurochrysis_carterae.AAC.1
MDFSHARRAGACDASSSICPEIQFESCVHPRAQAQTKASSQAEVQAQAHVQANVQASTGLRVCADARSQPAARAASAYKAAPAAARAAGVNEQGVRTCVFARSGSGRLVVLHAPSPLSCRASAPQMTQTLPNCAHSCMCER